MGDYLPKDSVAVSKEICHVKTAIEALTGKYPLDGKANENG